MVRRISLLLSLLLFSLMLTAQSVDMQVGQLVNSSNWIELNRIYPQIKDSVKTPMLRNIADAMIGYEFNHPQQASNAIYALLQNHQQELGTGNTFNFILILAKVLKQHGNYVQAATTTANVVDALKGVDQSGVVKLITDFNSELQAIKDIQPMTITRPDHDVVVNSDEKWTVPVGINGKKYNSVLRQTSEHTTITPGIAKEAGLRLLPGTFNHSGGSVQIAVIDSMNIGGITVRNLLADVSTAVGDQLIIGRDFMRAVGETRLDIDNKKIVFPKTFTPKPESGSNFTWDLDIGISNGHHCIAINYKDMFVKELRENQESASTLDGEHELHGVTIEAARHLVKSDMGMLTYDVRGDIESRTKSLFEMLRKVPLVTVDGQDNIMVKGSPAFRFYRNGHPDPSLNGSTAKNILKSIPASSISKVEVITEPGAKYDAEGTMAIVNIVTRESAKLSGAVVNLSSTVNNRGSSQSSIYSAAQVGKLIVSDTYSLSHLTPKEQLSDSRSETHYRSNGQQLEKISHNSGHGDIHYINIGASYDIDSLNLLTLSLGGSVIPFHSEGYSKTARYNSDESPLYSYKSVGHMSTNYRNMNARLDYQHKMSHEGEMLTASYMLSTLRNKTSSMVDYSNMANMPVDYSGYDNHDKTSFQEHTFQLDYVLPLGKNNKIETGAKYIYRLNKSDTKILYFGPDNELITPFDHTSHIAAVYGVWTFTANHFSMRPGIRYEYTFLKGSYRNDSMPSFHQNLSDWVPSLNMQWKFDDSRNLQLSYLTSINRPGINYLNPAVVSTPESKSFGNSCLKSTHNSQIVLTYTTVKPKFFNEAICAYGFSNKSFVNVQYEDHGIQVYTYDNVARYRMSAIMDYLQWMPSPGTTLSANASLNWIDMKNPAMNVCNVGCSGSINGNLSQRLWWNMRMNAGFSTTFGKNASLYGVDANSHSDYMSLQRSFLNDKLTLSIYASCMFENNRALTTRNVRGDYTGYTRTVSKARQFGLTATLQLGKMKEQVKQTDRTIENNDVVGGAAPSIQQKKLSK